MEIPTWARYRPFSLVWKIFRIGPIMTEVWFDELRLSNINDQGGYAANGRVDIKIADLGTLYLSGSTTVHRIWIASTRVSRTGRSAAQPNWMLATNLELGKLFPRKPGIVHSFLWKCIPELLATPEYDPYDLDIKLTE